MPSGKLSWAKHRVSGKLVLGCAVPKWTYHLALVCGLLLLSYSILIQCTIQLSAVPVGFTIVIKRSKIISINITHICSHSHSSLLVTAFYSQLYSLLCVTFTVWWWFWSCGRTQRWKAGLQTVQLWSCIYFLISWRDETLLIGFCDSCYIILICFFCLGRTAQCASWWILHHCYRCPFIGLSVLTVC